jgi:hypothetical protein
MVFMAVLLQPHACHKNSCSLPTVCEQYRRAKKVHQQHLRYIQSRGLAFNLVKLFNHNLSKQVKEWRGKGKQVILMMGINDHPLQNNFYKNLKEQNTDMEEFTHKCWGLKELYTHHSGKSPIDGGYKMPEVEIVNLEMLTFVESPGYHQSFVLDVSTRSLLGVYRCKVCWSVSRRLVTLQESSVKKYNRIVWEQFEIHRIKERLNAVDNTTKYCGYPSPRWL